MSRISRNLAILLKAERLMARRRMAVAATRAGLFGFAALVAALGVIMLNVAAFFALRDGLGPAWAALAVAGANLALAVILALVAARASADSELEPVAEMRDMALADLEAEADETIAEIRALAADMRRVTRDPLGTLLPGLTAPLVAAVIASLRKDGAPPDDPGEADASDQPVPPPET